MSKVPNIVLGVAGSIAVYKAAELVRRMVRRKWQVSVVMTRAAEEFVGEVVLGERHGAPPRGEDVQDVPVGLGFGDEVDVGGAAAVG